MKRLKECKKILAFLLVLVLVLQSAGVDALSLVGDDSTTETTTEATSEVTTQTTAETTTVSGNSVTGKVMQQMLVQNDKNYIKYTITLKNESTEAAATDVDVKMLLPELVTYEKTMGASEGLQDFESQNKVPEELNLDEFTEKTLRDYKDGSVIMWTDLTLAAGEEKELLFFGAVEMGALTTDQLECVCYVDGKEAENFWKDANKLIKGPKSTEEEADTEATTEKTSATTEAASDSTTKSSSSSGVLGALKSAVSKLRSAGASLFDVGSGETTSNHLSEYITSVVLQANSSENSPIYDADNEAYDNGWFFLKLEFAEKENLQFPVYDENNATATTLTYQIPEGIKGFDAVGPTNIVKTGTTEVYGTYEISESGLISIKFNEKVLTYTNCSSYLIFQAQFDRDKINGQEEYTFNFEGTEGVTIKFKPGGALSGSKTASEYNPKTGTFTFTITIDAADPLTNVVVKDTMGENLVLLKDSVKLDGTPISVTETTDGFTVTFEALSKGTHRLTYEASIDRNAMLSYNGTPIPGLDNSATLDADGQTTVPVKGDAEHSHQWLAKSNSGVDENTKKVTWNVTLYTDGLTNLTIHDKLPSSGLNYDRSTPISVSPSINGKNTLSWDEVEVGSDGKSWTYTLEVEGPAESYTFSYQTTVESDAKGKLSNTVTVDGNFPTKSEVDLGEGIGTGEGTGTVDKTVGEVVTEGSTKYVPWKSTIHLSAGEHENVIYTDTLYGTHKFADDLSLTTSNQYSKITVTASDGSTFTPTLTSHDDKSFVLDFGDLNLNTDTDITIYYYSVVEKNGNLSNVGDLSADGAASSDSENTTVVDQNFSKTGVYDENTGLITWRIYLNKKGNTLTGYMRVEDTFSSNQELVPYEGSPYWGAKALLYYNGVPQGAYPEVNGNKLILNFNPNTDQELYLEYQTKLIDDVSRDEAVTANNGATIYVNNQEVGNVDQDVVIPSNLFDKKLIGSDPSKENNYQAQFQINVNESGIKLCPDGTVSDDYIIEDTLSANMSLDVSSIRIYQKVGNSWNQLSMTESADAYYKVDLSNENHKIVITIKNPETTDNRTYKIEYSAQIQTGSGMGTVDWDNAAAFRAGSTYKTDTEEGTVKKEQSSDSGITGSHLYIEVYKYDAVTVTAMAGVTFNVYELNADGTKNGAAVASGTTNAEGKLILGQDPTASVATGYAFKENQRYMLEEVTPEGYLVNDPVYFQIGDKIDDSKYTVHRIGDTFNIANMPKVSLTVTKDWADSNNQDGTRPGSIQVQLKQTINGTTSNYGDSVTLNNANNWTYTWNDLPKKNDAGLITYTVDEVSVPDGYTKSVTEDTDSTETAIKYTIQNTYKPQVTTKTVTKQWNDSNNQDGIRPENITLELQYKVGDSGTYEAIDADFLTAYSKEGSKIQYQLNGTGSWTDVTSATVTLTGDASVASWSCSWRNLPQKIGGQTVSYEVKETSTLPTGYTVDDVMAGSDNKIVNSHITEKISKSVTKYWANSVGTDDNGNRPSKVTVQLKQSYNGGTPADYGTAVELSSANNWTYTWAELPKYVRVNNQSYEAVYTIVETAVPQYETIYYNNGSANGDAVASGGTTGSSVSIQNRYNPEKISVEAQKVWKDNSNVDKMRPTSITLALEKSSDQTTWTEVSTKTISKNTNDSQNNQSWTGKAVWDNLLKYENGQKVYYRVVEKNGPSGYSISYNINSFDATDIITGGKQDIVVTNTHGAKVNIQFSANKSLTGKRSTAVQAGEFTFGLYNSAGALLQSKTNVASGEVTFDQILYEAEGTYYYTISEIAGSDPSIQYSSEVYNVSVKVEMNDAGQLIATPTITKNGTSVSSFDNVTFTNTYKASGSGSISGTKNLDGKVLTEGEFTFGLFESEDDTTPIKTATNAANGNFTITTPTYYQNDIGTTKTYYLKEIADSSKSKIYDYDNTVYTVEVAISDAGNGRLNVVPTIKNSKGSTVAATFTNNYKASGSLTLTASKTVTGRPDVPNQFEFELYKLDSGTSEPSGTPLQTKTNNGAGISFDPITYLTSDIGETYYYAVKEKAGTNSAYTYDSVIYYVKAEVKHGDTAGSIKVDTTYYKGSVADNNIVNSITFNNTYEANGSITLTGKKYLNGKNLTAGQFTFTLYELTTDGTTTHENQIGSAVTNAADGTITFPTLTYTQANIGTHYYRIRETNAGNGAYAYADPVDVTINVNASNDGTLQVLANKNGAEDSSGRGNIVFNNTYTANVDVNLIAKKVLNGRTLANEQFTFTLTGDGQDGNNVSQTKTNNENGIITFDTLSFTQADIGETYNYTLEEVIPDPGAEGYTYDETQHQVAIEITDENDNGKLTATVTVDDEAYDSENPPTFTNSYVASGDITLGGTKSITGKTLDANEFTFGLFESETATEPITTATNAADGSFAFETITYDQSQVGDHVYFIKEIIPDPGVNGYSYDEKVFKVTVNVADNGDSTLSATIKEILTIREGENPVDSTASGVVFSNIYEAEGTATLTAFKVLDGRVLEDNQFIFKLYDKDETTVLQTKNNNAAGDVIFDPISYDETKLGTHTYYIKEENTNASGYTYSTDVYRATVTVEDNNHDGKLTTSVVYEKLDQEINQYSPIEGTTPTFTNTYEAEGSITVSGTKTLTGNKALQNQQFNFILTDKDGNTIREAKNDANGNFTFPALTYNQDDVKGAGEDGLDFTYNVKEVPPENAATDPYDYDTTVYTVVIHVVDDGDGNLTVTQKSLTVNDESKKAISFTNHYNAKGYLSLSVTKQTNVPLSELQENTFSFSLSGSGINQTKNSDPKTGIANFDTIEYDEDDINATYFYTIREIRGRNSGYEYSNELYLIEVHISDNGDGTLKVDKKITNSYNEPVDMDKMVFINTYTATGSLTLEANKTLQGRELKEEQFTFTLDGKNVNQTKTNDADGKVTFDTINYDQNDIGKTFTYTVSETNDGADGYSYSTEVYTVTVTISDAGNGKLAVNKVITLAPANEGEEAAPVDAMEFTNTYAASGEIELKAHKSLAKDLTEHVLNAEDSEVYKFTVTEDDNVVATATNDANGNIAFPAIKYSINADSQTDLGEHTYVIRETKGTDPTAIYDDSEYTVTVNVTDNDDGTLNAEITKIAKDGKAIEPVAETNATDDSEEEDPKTETPIEFVNDFTRISFSKKSLTGEDELPGATLQILDKDGNIIDEWVSGDEPHVLEGILEIGETYTLKEQAPPDGYQYAADIEFTVKEDGRDTIIMRDSATEKSLGSISVTKRVAKLDGFDLVDLVTEDATFYVGLFTDEVGKHHFGNDYIRAIQIKKASVSEPVEFTNLPTGTYYILETDMNGNPIPLNETQTTDGGQNFICQVEDGTTNQVTLDIDTAKDKGEVNLVNVYYELPDGYSYKANIDITKEVLYKGSKTTVSDTFYAGVFTRDDAGNYQLYKEVELKQNDKVSVEVPLGGKDGTEPITYYVFETDGKGSMINKDSFVYSVSGEGEVTVSQDKSSAAITITNTVPESKGQFTILKVDENGKALPGAAFSIAYTDGTVIGTWTSSEAAQPFVLDPGTYIVTETTAPTGYVLGGPITVVVNEDGTVTVSGTDAQLNGTEIRYINVPDEEYEEDEDSDGSSSSKGNSSSGGSGSSSSSGKTGDENPIGLYLMLLIGASAVAGVLLIRRRKRG